jgi:hypothetical protein
MGVGRVLELLKQPERSGRVRGFHRGLQRPDERELKTVLAVDLRDTDLSDGSVPGLCHSGIL